MMIPAHSIGFVPEVLPTNATEFRVVLKDYRYIGANYTGTVRLTNATNPRVTPCHKEVIVGL
jgi:hypothetical protein